MGVCLGARFPEGSAQGGVAAFQPLVLLSAGAQRSQYDKDLSSQATLTSPWAGVLLDTMPAVTGWALLTVLPSGHTCHISVVSPDPGMTGLTLSLLCLYEPMLFIPILWL